MSPFNFVLSLSKLSNGALLANEGGGPHLTKLTVARMFLDASPLIQLILAGLLATSIAALAILAMGLMLPASGRAKAARFLESAMIAAPIAAALGAAWGAVTIFLGIANTNVSNLAVAAPGIAEAIMSVALGLATLLIAVIAYGVVKPRPAPRS